MAKYRREQWTEADIRCPFYMSNDGDCRRLRCEGYTEMGMVVSCFRTMEQRERHIGTYCGGRFEKCPVYRMVYDEKYKE